MKKTISALLSLCMLLCLAACASGGRTDPLTPSAGASHTETDATQGTLQESDGPSAEETDAPPQETAAAPPADYAVKLTVQISPVFEIYMDASGAVTAVYGVNAEAAEVCRELSFDALTAQEALRLLLQATKENGYFVTDTQPVDIQITASGTALPSGMSDALRLNTLQTVSEFTDDADVGLALSLKVPGKTAMDTVIRDGEAQGLTSDIAFDAGTQTSSETVIQENGSTCTRTYNAHYQLISEKTVFPGLWTVEKCFEDDVLTMEILDTEGGDHTVTCYWPNGKEKSTEHQGADGRTLRCSYNENGILISSYEVMPDGMILEMEFHDDGTPLKTTNTLPDGTVTSTFDELGNVILVETDRDGQHTREEYTYSGGQLVRTVVYFQDGGQLTKLETQFTSAGSTVTEYYANGGKIIRKYDTEGNTLSQAFYDANGKVYDNVDDWSASMNG